jgi:hypothetical protein
VERAWLLDQPVVAIWIFRSDGVHPAWVDALTLPITGSSAFLEMADGIVLQIRPCEVNLAPDRYPGLGLALERVTAEALQLTSHAGGVINAVPLAEAADVLPFSVIAVETSDPLGEDTVSQIRLDTSTGCVVTFRHIFPPITLGMRVDVAGGRPGSSSTPTPRHGPDASSHQGART